MRRAVRAAVKSPAPHEHVPPGQRGPPPQGQAWLAAGSGGQHVLYLLSMMLWRVENQMSDGQTPPSYSDVFPR